MITVVVNGRFHAFDYAAELNRRGLLLKLISSMPYSVAKKYGISRRKYVGLPLFEVMKRAWRILFKREFPAMLYYRLFTRVALQFVPAGSKVVISNAGCCEEIFISEKLKRAMKILDRGSTHTLSNIRLNRAAAEYHHTNWISNPQEFVNRELREYELADRILVPSVFVKETFMENGIPEEKMIKIPYAFSSRKFEGITESRYKKELAVLFVGQICPRKGIMVLVNAMRIVRTRFPEAKLWLVGSLNPLINKSEIELDWIHHFGILRGEKLMGKYLTASVFCLLSFEEGLALVLTEAKRFGLPIIATPNSGAEELIVSGKDGYIVAAGDHLTAADIIIKVLEMKPDNSINDIRIEKSDFSWQKYCDQLITDYIHEYVSDRY